MVAWMNRDAIDDLERCTGAAHAGALAQGATSGHVQTMQEIRYDCDADVLLVTIEQAGRSPATQGRAAVSTKTAICRRRRRALAPPTDACELFRVIEETKQPEEGSYTNKLLAGGDNSILKKIGEESAEFVMACKDDNPEEIAGEAADILFHMQVALAHHGVSWREVQQVLAARRGAPRRHSERSQSSQGPSD